MRSSMKKDGDPMQQINQGLRGRVEGCRLDLREIDRLIAGLVMGWETEEFRNIGITRAYTEDETITIPDDFCPSENIKDAWVVVDKLKIQIIPQSEDAPSDCKYLALYEEKPYEDIEVFNESAPLAICLAALKAVGVEVEA